LRAGRSPGKDLVGVDPRPWTAQRLRGAEPIPKLFHPAREKVARFAGLEASALEQLLVTEYEPGATIGWHKDRPMFADVIGVWTRFDPPRAALCLPHARPVANGVGAQHPGP
jgi:hypothetical protein